MLKYLVLMFNVSLAIQIVLVFDGLVQDDRNFTSLSFRLISAFVFVNLGVLFAKIVNDNLHMYDTMAIINNVAFIATAIIIFFCVKNSYVSSLDGIVTALPSLYFFVKEKRTQGG